MVPVLIIIMNKKQIKLQMSLVGRISLATITTVTHMVNASAVARETVVLKPSMFIHIVDCEWKEKLQGKP